MKQKNTYRTAIIFLAITVLAMLFFSCLSFNIGDWPSSFVYPHNRPVHNWCGVIGSFLAYYLLYYVGPGIFIVLISLITMLIARLTDHPIRQPILRLVGLVLLTVAGSSTFYCFWPDRVFTFPFGSGGILGVAATQFMQKHFALLGTFILLLASWIVGAVLLADSLVIGMLHWLGFGLKRTADFAGPAWTAARQHSQVISEIWQKLSARQKTKPATVFSTDPDIKIESHFEPAAKVETPITEAPAREAKETNPKQIKVTLPQARKPSQPLVQKSYDDYTLPPLDLLAEPEYGYSQIQSKVVESKAKALEKLLGEFNIDAHVVAAETGPVITMFELELAAGIKVSQISTLANDMARALGAGAVRVVAPLPGKHTIGIEVPNSEKEKVRIKDLMQLAGTKAHNMQIPLFLGKDSSGEALVSDLTKMPHMLIAGTTGSGKSVCINSIIVGTLLTKRPDEVKMILIDPKMVEMTAFNTIPHLMCPIVTETQRAVQILEWATVKMDERYSVLAEARVKNIAQYNALGAEEIIRRFEPSTPEEEAKIPKKLPYFVIIIDELADLMMTAAKEIESYIVRLAQKSRAVGIHIVLATQRPQATVVTGLIKSNMPTRIGFRVAARMDSRIILDQNGAETLLGEGDMLFLKPGTSDLVRAQGSFVDDSEIRKVVKYLKESAEPQFHPELMQLRTIDASDACNDDLFDDAVRIVLETKRGSVSLLQRRLNIGYARSSRLIESMAGMGILGEYKGSQAREVMITLEDYERMCQDQQAGADNDNEPEKEPAYVAEGERGYVAVMENDDEDE